MALARPPFTGWAAGEISPRLGGRIDVNFFHIAARALVNMRPLPHGPVEKRGGTLFVGHVHDASELIRLLPFSFSGAVDQSYVLEIGAAGVHFLADLGAGPGLIGAAATDAVITNGTFTADIAGWTDQSTGAASIAHDAANGRLSLVGAAAAIAIAEQAPTVTTGLNVEHVLTFRLYGSRYDTVNVRVGSSSGGEQLASFDLACSPGGSSHSLQFTPAASPFFIQFRNSAAKTVQVDDVALLDDDHLTLPQPWPEAERPALKTTQSNDVLWVCHRNHWPRTLERRGHATWSLVEYAAEDGPYLPENTTAGTLQPGAATGLGITITAAAGAAPFVATDVGRLVTIKHSTTWGWAVITGFTSATVVTADVRGDFGAATAQTAWRLGLWRDTAGGGFHPPDATFAHERLFFAGPTGRFDASKTGAFDVFTPGTDDDSPLSNTIADNQTNRIQWLAAGSSLLIGTAGAEFLVGTASGTGVLTPGTVAAKAQSKRGSADVKALAVGNAVLFLQQHRTKLIESQFALEIEAFDDTDLTRRGEHLTRLGGGVTALAWQQEPYGMVWAVRADGLLLSLTYLRDEQVIAWARDELGRSAAGLAEVESVAVIPGDGEDDVWLAVKRTIDGQVRRTIEVLQEPLADDEPIEDAFYVDCGLKLDNTVAATLTPGAGATVKGTTGVTFTAGSSVFVAGDVGRFIRYRYEAVLAEDDIENPGRVSVRTAFATAVAEITSYTSGTEVTGTIVTAWPSLAAIASGGWRLTVTTVSGLDHLEGETVAVLGDGAVQPSQVVTAGAITLDSPAATVIAGLAYTALLVPVRFEAGAQDGTAQGRKQRVAGITIRLHRTGEGFTLGGQGVEVQRPPVRQVTDAMDFPPSLVSFDVFCSFPGKLARDPMIRFRSAVPLPATVTMLMPKVEVNE